MMKKHTKLSKALLMFCVLGLLITLYIEISTLLTGAPQCLGGGGGCKTVENSVYSHIYGIPVVYFGIAGYFVMSLNVLLYKKYAPLVGLFLAFVGMGTEAYLVYLQAFKINAFCQWCMASVFVMLVVFVLTIVWWLKSEE